MMGKAELLWCVYMHEHRVNGKKYIGITSQKPESRWANGEGYRRCPRFYYAIRKYGWDTFHHEILFTDLPQTDAEQVEIELIAKYHTTDPEHGYNLASGGRVNAGFHRSDEFRKKLSESLKGVLAGENHPMYGKHKSEETKQKIRATQIGRPKNKTARLKMRDGAKRRWAEDNVAEREYYRRLYSGGNSVVARRVLCVETGVQYPAIRVAAEETGVGETSITRCCRGQRNTAGGFHWAYAEGSRGLDA